MGVNQAVVGGQGGELVGGGHERKPRQLGDDRGDPVPEARRGVEPRPDRGPPDGQLVQARQRGFDPFEASVQLRNVSGEFLSQGERDCVLQMGPADLHDVGEVVGLGRKRAAEGPDRRKERLDHGLRRGDMHGRGECVVR